MASSSDAPAGNPFGQSVQEKLTRENFLVWKAVVLPAVRGARLFGYLDGSVKAPREEIFVEKEESGKKVTVKMENPAFVAWNERDQQVLSYLLTSISREVLVQISEHETAHEAWSAIQAMYASQSRSRIIGLRRALNDLKKRKMSHAAVYFNKLKGLTDELAMAGKKLEEDDIINAVLNGLDEQYNPLVEAISARLIATGISLSEVYAMLLASEARLEAQSADAGGGGYSVNLASRGGYNGQRGGHGGYRGGANSHRGSYDGGRGNQGQNTYDGGRGNNSGGGRQQYGYGQYNNNSYGGRGQGNRTRYTGPPCQICNKASHPAYKCFKRFNRNFVTPEIQANAATSDA
jgi:hypothetical protein